MLEKIKYYFRKFALRGGNVYCNICERSYLTFLPAGDDLKAHSRCPGCYSLDRHRQLFTLVSEQLKTKKENINLLHVAPEKAMANRFIKMSQVEYFAIDKFDKGYAYPKYVRAMDITDLKFGSNMFDILICSHVLEHVEKDELALQNFRRVLKPGGIGYIVVPYFKELATTYSDPKANTDELRLLLYGQHDHVRKYGLDFIELLRKNGFQAEEINFNQMYSLTERIRLGYLNAEPIFKIVKLD